MELLLERDKVLSSLPPQQVSPNASTYDPLSLAGSASAAKLLAKPLLILDGGLGTTLADQYEVEYSPSQTPTWSSHFLIAEPETLLAAQTAFSRQGADILLTATYQASYEGYAATPHPDDPSRTGYSRTEAGELMRSAQRAAKFAIGSRQGLVALSLGPYGATMLPASAEYTGRYPREMGSEDALYSWHFDRIKPYGEQWTDLDLVAFETVPRVDEIRAVRRVMRRIPARKLYWVSVVFAPEGDTLPDGTGVQEVLAAMLDGDNPPWAIGLNCVNVSRAGGLVKKFEEAAERQGRELPKLVVYPDGAKGQRYDSGKGKWVGEEMKEAGGEEWEDAMVRIVREVQERGKWKGIIAGGCCKTTPKMIGRLKKKLEQQ